MKRIKEIVMSVKNIIRFWKVIWDYRWYDFQGSLELMARDLEIREKYWVKHTHYVGEKFTLGRIKIALKYYKEWQEADLYTEYDKMKRFIKAYARLVPRLWD